MRDRLCGMSGQQPPPGQPQYPQQPPAGQPQYVPPPGYQYPQPVQTAVVVEQEIRRPFGVTLVALLALLIGTFDVCVGIYLLLNRNSLTFQLDLGMTTSAILSTGAVYLVVGAITLMLSIGLFGGSRLSRAVIALLCVIRLALAVYVVIVSPSMNSRTSAAVSGLISILLLLLLFGGARTKRFFAQG